MERNYKYKVGEKIVYLGTKSVAANSLEDWEEYFGKFGIKKGDRGVIHQQSGEGYFIKDSKKGNATSGLLGEQDIMLESDYILKFEKNLTKRERTKLVNKIVKEIESTPSFKTQFKGDIKGEIEKWEDLKLLNWK
jgi:hypothetical protein